MTRLEKIEKDIVGLTADEFARFREWFEDYDATRFDARIERDAETGKLDSLADEALADFRAGKSRPL
ncbi:hypothetical protein [Consotaella aegiceratis]|uniref:hypothetical protein n=1 Tax=Consotaella aegiceratis TaxID=3097961 RepID=UPI002F3EBFB2